MFLLLLPCPVPRGMLVVAPPFQLQEGPKPDSRQPRAPVFFHSPSQHQLHKSGAFPYRQGQELASKRVVTQDPCSPQKQIKGLGILPEQHLLVWKTVFGNLVSCKASLDHPGTLRRKTAARFQHSSPDEGGALLWRLQSTRLLRPWDFPGKSTGVGCHCLLQVSGYSSLYYTSAGK